MQLELECSWNKGKNKAKQLVCFDYRPTELFQMPREDIALFQQELALVTEKGPKALEQLKMWYEKNPSSLYVAFHLYKGFAFFKYEEEQSLLLQDLEKKFPDTLLLKCIRATLYLQERDFKNFISIFKNKEVAKALISKRKFFYFEEILSFHHLWAIYFQAQGDLLQSQKHQKLLVLIINTRNTLIQAVV